MVVNLVHIGTQRVRSRVSLEQILDFTGMAGRIGFVFGIAGEDEFGGFVGQDNDNRVIICIGASIGTA